ncbi:MAG: hypothetical protein K2H29_02220, partial [Oscillospiraceae bacterium]|nr:hypothetical protein [Oscillospiraceae bacterium]
DLLAELLNTESVTASCIDASKPETIGIYQREGFAPRECIGTESSYQTARIRIFVHWTDNPSRTEKKTLEIAELFSGFEDMETENHIIKFAEVKAVRNIGKDEKGICEYIVDADLIYIERTI